MNKRFKTFICFALSVLLAGCATAPVDYTAADAPRAEPLQRVIQKRPVIGLVLGAGGSRGFAHVGVLKVLEAEGIHADVVVGVSSGALVAALHAGGFRAAELEAHALKLEDDDLIDYTLFGPGYVIGEKLQAFVNTMLHKRPIEALPKPFAVIAAESGTRRMAVFNRGNTGVAVRASASVPRLFWPVVIRGTEYVDGGLASRVPASVARDMGADVVIAVDISWRGSTDATSADVVIRPQLMRGRITDFSRKLEHLASGEQAARDALPQLRERLAQVAAEKSGTTQINARARTVN